MGSASLTFIKSTSKLLLGGLKPSPLVPLHCFIHALRSWANLTQTWYLLMSSTTMGIGGLCSSEERASPAKMRSAPGDLSLGLVGVDCGREWSESDWTALEVRFDWHVLS